MLCWNSLPMGCNWWYLRSSLDKEIGTISKMDRRKVDGDSSQSQSPEWKMRDVSFPILMFPFILFEFCKCLFFLGVACVALACRAWALGPFPSRWKSSAIITALHCTYETSSSSYLLLSLRPRSAPCCAAARLFASLTLCLCLRVSVRLSL